MPVSGGRFPYDALEALSGPARILLADTSEEVPVDPYAIVPAIAAAGEYPAIAPWRDTGLMADAPSYSHGKETAGLEYEQVAGALFEKVEAVNRSFTAQVAGISAENLQLIENAPAVETIAAAAGKPAGEKVPFGLYTALKRYRVALVADRPDGAGIVTEPGGVTRPPSVILVMFEAGLAAEDSEVKWSRGEPVNVEVSFTLFPASGQTPGEEHGYWWLEQVGVIAAGP